MRAVVQRVGWARVWVGEQLVGRIGAGLLALVGVTHGDGRAEADKLAVKLWGLRVFADADGAMNLAAADVGGDVLVVSQFTLYGDTRRGRRPSWAQAAPPAQAEPLIDALVTGLRGLGATVATGRFGAHMRVESENDGPVTLIVEV